MNKKYPRISFKKRLKKLDSEMESISSLALENYSDAIALIGNYDAESHKKILEVSENIEKKVLKLEKLCISFLATEQPVAKDLRFIETCIKVASHFKRIGITASKIVDSLEKIKDQKIDEQVLDQLIRMSKFSQMMLVKAINGFSEEETSQLSELRRDDNELCEQFNFLLEDITRMISDNKESVNIVVQLIFIARYLERTADRAVNIGDRVIFMLTYKYPGV